MSLLISQWLVSPSVTDMPNHAVGALPGSDYDYSYHVDSGGSVGILAFSI